MSEALEHPSDSRPALIQSGPYRATQLWNEVLQTFQNGIVTGKHRRQLKTYDDCFVASEAVTWLHEHLESNPNFGPCVSRAQTVQLLEKFRKTRLFEDVRGAKSDKEVLTDNGRLFRFISKCDGTKSLPRQPLSSRSSNINEKSSTMPSKGPVKPSAGKPHIHASKNEPAPVRQPPREPECHLMARPSQLSKTEVEEIWRDLTLNSLQKLLRLKMVEEVVDPGSVNAENLIHNMTFVNRNGIVSNIDKKDQLPHWVISAMRHLAYWPDEVNKDFPMFKGFEKDVFKVVKDYFEMLHEPLVTFSMYDLFINCMAYADSTGKPARPAHPSAPQSQYPGLKSYTSAENLILNMTQTSSAPSDDVMVVHDPELPHERSRRTLQKQSSVSSMPGARIETSFGVDVGKEPRSQLYRQTEDHGYFNAHDNTLLPSQQSSRPGSRRSESFMMSLDNMYDRTKSAPEPPESPRSRYYSMTNVNEMPPFQQNGFRERSDTCNSWASSVNSMLPNSQTGDKRLKDFGYTVVLSTAPKVETEGRGPPSHYRSHGAIYNGSQGAYAESSDTGFGSKRASYVSDISDRSTDPPPYVPPPSYNTLFNGRSTVPRSETCSACSFESARSQNNSMTSNHRTFKSPPSQYQSAEGSPMEYHVHNPHNTPPLARQKSGVNLAESYRAAIDNSFCSTTPVGRSLFAPLKRANSSPSILSPMSRNRIQEVLQICCLMMPPSNRRKLHLLLRFMNKVTYNERLVLDKKSTNRQLMLKVFTRLILRPEDEADFDEIFTYHVVSFLLDNYHDVMKVPDGLKLRIEDRVSFLKRQKVSVEQYESQKMSSSQRALTELLESIVRDKNMPTKEKKKRLKQFQKSYPDIYARRFPTTESEAGLFPNKPKIKPPLLSRPLQKLKSFRI